MLSGKVSTTENWTQVMRQPFILQFARQLPEPGPRRVRYNPVSQMSEVFVNGRWVYSVDTDGALPHETRITLVGRETTDDD